MCAGVALAWSEIPTLLIREHRLYRRAHKRGVDREVRFLIDALRPRLSIWRDGQFQVARWGNVRGQSGVLPRTGWTWLSTIEDGGWQGTEGVPVVIPASAVCERGVWYPVLEGIRGLLVPDEHGAAVVYMICEQASHYYQIMTRSDRMPVLIGERI